MRIKRIVKVALWTLGIAVVVAVLFQGPYWYTQVQYRMFGIPKVEYQEPKFFRDNVYPANQLTIPTLGIQAPLVYMEGTTEEAFQEALQSGVVHYPGTAEPGQSGNAYYFGHSSDYPWGKGEYKTVFALLPSIKVGDKIAVTNKEGGIFEYVVQETKVVSPDDLSVLSQETDGKKLLSLQTSYPVGTALKRFIVIAELIAE
jgi:LPXTG-site transpeptidase (sortase) family protein